jgi:hypothetical protein
MIQISHKMPELREEEALVLVAGTRNAIFYKIKGGHINQVESIKVLTPKYSDNEGHFKVRAKGTIIRSGSVREVDNIELGREFLSEINSAMGQLSAKSSSQVYVFAPSQIKIALIESLPPKWRSRVTRVVEGNFTHNSPNSIIDKLKEIK